jgi:hypothetical protein
VDPYSLFFVEVVLMQFAELKRLQVRPCSPGREGQRAGPSAAAAAAGALHAGPARPALFLLFLSALTAPPVRLCPLLSICPQDYRNPGSQGKQYFLGLEAAFNGSGAPAYPGGQFFNLFNFGKTEAGMNEMKLKEVKNGRLAMLAMFGYGAQAVATQEGPFANLTAHLADPVHNNLLGNFATVLRHQ